MFEQMMAPLLGAPQITESVAIQPGTAVTDGRGLIIMHPLDVIAIRYPDALERLPHAMAWILDQAHEKLDAVAERIGKPKGITGPNGAPGPNANPYSAIAFPIVSAEIADLVGNRYLRTFTLYARDWTDSTNGVSS